MEAILLSFAAIIIICAIILGGSWIIDCIKMNPDDLFPGDKDE